MRTVGDIKKSYPWIGELSKVEIDTLFEILNFAGDNKLISPSMFGGDELREEYGVVFQMEWVGKTSFCSITVNPEGEESLYEFFYLDIESNETRNLDTNNLSEVLALLAEMPFKILGGVSER